MNLVANHQNSHEGNLACSHLDCQLPSHPVNLGVLLHASHRISHLCSPLVYLPVSLPCNQVLIHPCNHPASLVGNLRNNQQFYRHGNLLMYQHLSRQDIRLHFQALIHQRHQVDNPARYLRSNHPGNRCQIRRRNHMDIHRLNPLINP